MQALLGKTLEEITLIMQQNNLKSFVAKQICNWIYAKGIENIASMSNLSLHTREKLQQSYYIGTTSYIKEVISKDGTKKYLFQYGKDVFVEAVLIFDNNNKDIKLNKNISSSARTTLCISTQAGCRMNCAFCATGKQGFLRNLTSNEIINIFHTLNNDLQNRPLPSKIDNIVFMGMGEPLDNFVEVKKTLEILTSDWGYALSARRITVSTCGFMPKMKEFLDTTQVDVAISLHNAISIYRKEMMPIEKAYPIQNVVNLLKQYNWKGQRHLTFEYIVFDKLNDKAENINAIAKLLNGLPCRINLIPFNFVPNTSFKGVSKEKMLSFAQKLKNKGFIVTIRQSKGADISAACGLLSTKEKIINISST